MSFQHLRLRKEPQSNEQLTCTDTSSSPHFASPSICDQYSEGEYPNVTVVTNPINRNKRISVEGVRVVAPAKVAKRGLETSRGPSETRNDLTCDSGKAASLGVRQEGVSEKIQPEVWGVEELFVTIRPMIVEAFQGSKVPVVLSHF